MSSVAIVRCEQYEQALVDQAVAVACKIGEMPDVRDKRILLKPNILSDAKEERGITTHSAVLRAMIRHLKSQGAKEVLVGDSPGLQKPNFQPKASGIYQVCEEEGVQWIDFTKQPKTYTIPYTRGKKLPLAAVLSQVDMVFSLPKFKTHQLMYATGAVKNLFGLVPNLYKSPCHVQFPSREQFAALMVGIASIVKPAFSLMDGIIAMEGPGPANGISRHLGLLIASRDPVALDYAQAQIMGYDPLLVPIVAEGIRRGLGDKPTSYPALSAEKLVQSDYIRIEMQKRTSFIHSLIVPFVFSHYIRWKVKKERKAPVFLVDSCIGCRKCIDICPAGALTMVDKRIIIDPKACIRCYCCHEVCPASAILVDEVIPS
ncbi:MAG: DUF362 domain-containing protein [Sphaerochaeta sp.]|jgi:uncharacterized protein (DUF362 family)/Pyruvate/2-oxoacid:ferredoxin oxidoreductase delta subunit|uniref:DUF362 domain-containing protein n=1 Tax=Sphaerochaeta sp. TaxID=1972642 RepID=UPI003D0D62F8